MATTHLATARWTAVALFAMAAPASADYFHDQNLVTGRVKTDYVSSTKGRSFNPLTINYPCIYNPAEDPLAIATCFPGPTSFPATNSWEKNGATATGRYWVIDLNVEPWAKSLSGPPNQTFPRVSPGQGVMGFDVIYGSSIGEYFNRAHLVLNNTFPSAQLHDVPPDGQIPFLSFGAEANRGNGGVLGVTDSTTRPGTVEFTVKLWDMWPSQIGQIFQMYASSYWQGKPRMLFINLYGQGRPDVVNWSSTTQHFKHVHWPWPVADSFYYPGADIVFIDLERLDVVCGSVAGNAARLNTVGQQRTYRIDLTTSFRCLSSLGAWDVPMPSGPHPINSIHWANESIGKEAAIWTSVHGMQMLPARVINDYPIFRGGPGGIDPYSTPVATSFDGATGKIFAIKRSMEQACRNNRACWARNQALLRSGQRPVVRPRIPHKVTLLRELAYQKKQQD